MDTVDLDHMGFHSALTLDVPRSRKALEHLLAHPEEHNQQNFGRRTWCKTTMCIAGTVILQDAVAAEQVSWEELNGDDGVWFQFMCSPDPSGAGWIEDTAANLLGLTTSSDVQYLFYEFNNRLALNRLAVWIEIAERSQADAQNQ